jgi:hypothetical protein
MNTRTMQIVVYAASTDVDSPSLAGVKRVWDRITQRERCGEWVSYIEKESV